MKGLTAVFYDRKNNREVKNTQLCFINYVVDVAVVEPESGIDPLRTLGHHQIQLGELGYKSDGSPTHSNWDLTCTYADLVFLRFGE